MIDMSAGSLLMVLDEDTAKKVWSAFRGCRIYFPKCKSEHDEIQSLYNKMMEGSTTRPEAITRLSQLFGKDERQIRRITKAQGGLFE